MQTIRDVIIEVVKDSLKYLERKQYIEPDTFLEEALTLHVLGNKKIKTVKNKTIKTILRKGSSEKPIILGTHTLLDIKICQLVSQYHKIEYNKLFIKCRERDVVDTRMQLAAVMYNYIGYSVSKIGQIFSKDHSTVINWLNVHVDLLETSKAYSCEYGEVLTILKEQVPEIFENIDQKKNKARVYRILKELAITETKDVIK